MIKTTPASTADIQARWDELVKSGKFRRGSAAAGGYVDNETEQWYSGQYGPKRAQKQTGAWNDLISAGKYRAGSARAGGYVDNATGKWYSPDEPPPSDDNNEEEQ